MSYGRSIPLAARVVTWLTLLATLPPLFAQALDYRVRLFWQSVPEAIEIAPTLPFEGPTAPRLTMQDGREVWLRGPLRLKANSNGLVIEGRFPQELESLEVNGTMRLRMPGREWSTLPGSLRVWATNGELEVEASLSREDYVKAVLAGEGGGLREPEALRALAVAIRSYAFARPDRHKGEGFHFCDTTHCQDLRLARRNTAVDEAVDATADELLWHGGNPVPAYHHANSGGYTESPRAAWGGTEAAWMKAVPDPASAMPKAMTWSTRIAKADLLRALRAEDYKVQDAGEVTVGTRTESGRAETVRIGRFSVRAPDFRFAVGRQLGWLLLKSDLYDVTDEGAFVRFNGKGSGHGVGLSQRGAEVMATQGKTYREILAFYFPGSHVGVDAQGITWRMLRSERLRFLFASGSQDSAFPPLVKRELARLESKSGFRLRNEVTIRVYPSVELYRNASGLGGDIAAATRGREIRFQPLAILRRNGNLDGTVRHELAHALVLQEAKVPLPEWFHEALARWLSGGHARRGNVGEPCRALASIAELERLSVAGDFEARQDAAFTADALLEAAVRRYGESTVLGWARMGLPREDDDTLRRLLREACQH